MPEQLFPEPDITPGADGPQATVPKELQAEGGFRQDGLGSCSFGASGHEGEYVVNLVGYDVDRPIPDWLQQEIQESLGEQWEVDSRGSRLEIFARGDYGKRDDGRVLPAVYAAMQKLAEGEN